MFNLVAAIFRLAAQDIKFRDKTYEIPGANVLRYCKYCGSDFWCSDKEIKDFCSDKCDALDFLDSEWFEELCEVFQADSRDIKKMILNYPISYRKSYE